MRGPHKPKDDRTLREAIDPAFKNQSPEAELAILLDTLHQAFRRDQSTAFPAFEAVRTIAAQEWGRTDGLERIPTASVQVPWWVVQALAIGFNAYVDARTNGLITPLGEAYGTGLITMNCHRSDLRLEFTLVDPTPTSEVAGLPPTTIEAMIETLDADLSLSQTRRRDLKSGLKVLLRVAGGSASSPATVITLRGLIGQMERVPGGLCERRRETLRSDVRAAACHCGLIPKRPTPSDLSEGWRAVKEGAPEIWFWRRASQLGYWASVNGIEPFDLDQVAFERFGHYLRNQTLEQDPERKLGVIAKAWNQLRHEVATPSGTGGATAPAVSTASTRDRVSGGWDDLPASFVADIEAYCRSVASAGLLLDDKALEKPLRPATVRGHREGFRRAGFMLLAAGFPPERLVAIRTLVEPDPFRLWVETYHARLGRKSPALFNLIATLAAWAQRTSTADETQIKVMRRAMTRIDHRRKDGMTPKNRDRIRQFTGALTRMDWLSYGDRLEKDAKALSPKRAALRSQTALIHEIMLVAPLRLTNLVQLRIGVNLVWQQASRQDRLFLVIPSAKVKNAVDLEFELPPRVAKLYRRYVETMRPLILVEDDASDWLWPGAKPGTHKTHMTGSGQLIERVRSDLGLAVNMHLYRHLAAWFYLQARPGDYETIRRLLGHKSIQTTINYYIEIDQMMISRTFNAVLDDLRSRPLPR